MLALVILSIAALFQVLAAAAAFRLVAVTGRNYSWVLMSTALLLMAVRRLVPLYYLTMTTVGYHVYLGNELIGLALSGLMLAGVAGIRPMFEKRKAAEAALCRNQALLQSVTEGTTDAVYVKDRDGRYLMVNSAACQFVGRSREEVLGNGDEALFPLDEAHQLMEGDRRVMASGVTQTYEEFVTIGGVASTFLSTKGPIRAVDGEVVGLFGIARNITDRKWTEESLRRANRALRMISDCNQELIHATNEPELLRSVCRTVVEHGEYRLAWIGLAEQNEAKSVRPVAQFGFEEGYLDTLHVTWDDVARGRGPTGTAIRTAQPVIARSIHTDPTYGPWRDAALARGYASSAALPLVINGLAFGALNLYSSAPDAFDAQELALLTELANDLAYGIGALRERAERERTESALRVNETRHRSILRTALDGFWRVDVNSRLLEVNEAYCRMSGYSEQELLAMGVADLEANESPAETAVRIQRIWAKGYERFETRHRRKDGSLFDVEVSVQFRPAAEGGMVAFLRDISERNRAEQERARLGAQLLQAQKMESVGRLAGGVAHDFNNMLSAILGHAELALEQVAPTQPLHADIEEIRKAAARSAELTRQLLAFARKQVVDPKVVDLNATVASMLKMLRRLIGEDVEFRWDPEAELWPVKIDPSQLDQILANLCVNARDAISGVGKLAIETAKVSLSEIQCALHLGLLPGDYVVLTVSDDGCGMDEDTQSHLFEPFFTTKGVGEGTGLGLATVYGIVQQNGGSIDVHSQPNEGTTFSVYLPRYLGTVEDQNPGSLASSAPRGHETILVVEDEAAILSLSNRILTRQGYTVISAGTPGEAIRLAKDYSGTIHLLLTDVVMPSMNGQSLAEKLRLFYPRLKCLFMSGYTADIIAHRGVLDDDVHFIQKPFSIESLAAKVRQVLDHAQAVGS